MNTICQTTEQYIKETEKSLSSQFEYQEDIRDFNQEKVLRAFIDNRVAPEHFYTVSGYGHDDLGKEVLDNVFAQVFKAEAAFARNHIVSGTHALSCVLFGNLRHGDKLVSVTGIPYDTMQEVIGTTGGKKESLIGHGIIYDEINLKDDGSVNFEEIEKRIDKTTTMVEIQRSRGYSLRPSVNIETIGKICEIVKRKNPDCICFVDNCYGEFVEKQEPLEVGADIIAGSLIKNVGGGLAETGGYVAGKKEYVEQSAMNLTAPGIGREGGAMLNQLRLIFQGLFMAPSVVCDAVKGAILASKIFEDIGYISTPKYYEQRTDLIQTITFHSKEAQETFCRTIQELSPINSYVAPIPDAVPGYEDKLIMAGGTFIEGSTIELSADGPVREPYAVYMQGGLTYSHIKIVLKNIFERVNKK